MITVITFIIVLGLLVFVHELGHFTAAKWLGIRVEEFGFGLPPRVWGKKIGETIYSFNWLPVGGFVRLYGEDEHDPDHVKKDRARAFFSKHPWQRAIVLVAGVLMNFILGWAIVSFLLTQGVFVPGGKVRVESVVKDSPADTAGIMAEDIIGQAVASDGTMFAIKVPQDLIEVAHRYLGQPFILSIERNNQKIDIQVTPRSVVAEGEGALGVVITNFYVEKKYSWTEAPFVGLSQSVDMMKMIVGGFVSIIRKAVMFQPVRADISGPIGIGKLVGEAREFGLLAVADLTAVLSFNLALINILPFPALDGGRLLFVVVEGITRKRINPYWEQHAHQIGMVILLILFLLVTINDVVKLVQG